MKIEVLSVVNALSTQKFSGLITERKRQLIAFFLLFCKHLQLRGILPCLGDKDVTVFLQFILIVALHHKGNGNKEHLLILVEHIVIQRFLLVREHL